MGVALTAGAAFALLIVKAAPFETWNAIVLVAAAFCVGYILAVATFFGFRSEGVTKTP
jgi:hypothetical protein